MAKIYGGIVKKSIFIFNWASSRGGSFKGDGF